MRKFKSIAGHLFRLSGRHPKILIDPATWIQVLEALQPRETGLPLIRIGEIGDGGYLLPDDLDGITTLISPGAGGNAGFELALELYGIHSIIIDDDDLQKPKHMPKNSEFINKKVSSYNSDNAVTLNSLVELAPSNSDLVLQMDIEGHEYAALNSIDRTSLDRFRIIVVEFHFTFDWIFEHNWKWNYQELFAKLLQNHVVVHLHPNNSGGYFKFAGIKFPNLIEVSLLRKDRIKELGGQIQTGNPLDADSDSEVKSMRRKGLGIS